MIEILFNLGQANHTLVIWGRDYIHHTYEVSTRAVYHWLFSGLDLRFTIIKRLDD